MLILIVAGIALLCGAGWKIALALVCGALIEALAGALED